jgi:hypothetical protein
VLPSPTSLPDICLGTTKLFGVLIFSRVSSGSYFSLTSVPLGPELSMFFAPQSSWMKKSIWLLEAPVLFFQGARLFDFARHESRVMMTPASDFEAVNCDLHPNLAVLRLEHYYYFQDCFRKKVSRLT